MLPDEGTDHGQVGIGAHAVLGAASGILGLEITHGPSVTIRAGFGIDASGIRHKLA